MTPSTTDSPLEHAGPTLLILLTSAVLVVVGCIAAFAYVAEWWLLPVAVFVMIAATGIVTLAIGQALGEADSGPPATPPVVVAEEQPQVAAAPEPVSDKRRIPKGPRPVLGH